MSLEIIQAKPNPAGKERRERHEDQDGLVTKCPEALFGEWVDVKNIGNDAVDVQTMQLRHALFDNDCHAIGELELYWVGDNGDLLKPGQVLRIHGGHQNDAHLMSADDQAEADRHGYAESDDFIFNNRCGDKLVLSWQDAGDQIHQDCACFAPNPPKDLILKRSGNLLAAGGAGSDINQ